MNTWKMFLLLWALLAGCSTRGLSVSPDGSTEAPLPTRTPTPTPTSQDKGEPCAPDPGVVVEDFTLRFPVEFHVLEAPDLRAATQGFPPRTLDDAAVQSLMEHLNLVWGQCGIELTSPSVQTHTLTTVQTLSPTVAELDAEETALFERIGKAKGSGPFGMYFSMLSPITFLPKKVSPILFQRPYTELGQSSLPVLVVPSAHVLHPALGTSLAHASISKEGLLDFYFNGVEPTGLDETRLITYGFDLDPTYENRRGAEDPLIGRYYSVLAHEVGHFLGLGHDALPGNLMSRPSGSTNVVLPSQCVQARAYLKRKLKRDLQGPDGRDCRSTLAERICRFKPGTGGAPEEKLCGDPSGYVRPLLALYDEYPDAAKRLMCGLESILVSPGLPFAGAVLPGDSSPDASPRLSLILREELFQGFWTIADFLTWKEQLSFGGERTLFQPARTDLPSYQGRPRDGTNGFLFLVVAHELGHVLHLKQNLLETWAPLSWTSEEEPLADNDFPQRTRMCFYFCLNGYLQPSEAPGYYQSLFNTSFLSSYAAQSPGEDFAETFAYVLWNESKGGTLTLTVPSLPEHDVLEHLRSERLRHKRAFIETWLRP